MGKRFTDTNKYKKPFIRGLQGAYKLLWDYLYHDCDHAGIWIVDFQIAQIFIGSDMQVNKSDALKYFNEDENRIIEFDSGKKWFIPSFIEFQYGNLNLQNRAHNSVIILLDKNNLLKNNKPLTSPLKGAKDKEMDKDKDMGKDKEKDIVYPFNSEKFKEAWNIWKKYKKEEYNFKYKSPLTEQIALQRLDKISGHKESMCIEIIGDSIASGWKGLFKLDGNNAKQSNMDSYKEELKERLAK